jgi:hypothetical protein
MTKMIMAKRRNLMGGLDDCHIRDAIYRPTSVYICSECGRYVRPNSDGPRFKHMTVSPNCSYSSRTRRKARS